MYDVQDGYVVAPRHQLDPYPEPTRWSGPLDFPFLDAKCTIQPRDELQADAQRFLNIYGPNPASSDAIVSLRCGEGKTFIALRAVFDYGYHTLIIAHTTDILLNWKKVILANTSVTEVGEVISGRYDLKPITLALIPSLLALPYDKLLELGRLYGCVVLDEMHHLAAPMFSLIGNAFPGRRIGLSATLAREDGLSFVYYKALGKRIFWRQSLRKKARVSMRRIPVMDVDFPENYARAVTTLANSNDYLGALIADIREGYRIQQKQFVVANRKDILFELRDRLQDLSPGVNTRETPAEERRDNLAVKPITLSIDTFGKEGLDEPTLTTLRVVTPMKDRNAVTQTVGRLERDIDKGDIEAIFYAPRHATFLSTLNKAREALVREGYRVYDIDPPRI